MRKGIRSYWSLIIGGVAAIVSDSDHPLRALEQISLSNVLVHTRQQNKWSLLGPTIWPLFADQVKSLLFFIVCHADASLRDLSKSETYRLPPRNLDWPLNPRKPSMKNRHIMTWPMQNASSHDAGCMEIFKVQYWQMLLKPLVRFVPWCEPTYGSQFQL